MEDYSAMIRNVFDLGSIRDAELLFEAIVKNAFPTNDFRRLELIRFVKAEKYMEGRSWNHVFQIKAADYQGQPVWYVTCQRVTMGTSPEKQAYLDYRSLNFLPI